MTADGTMYVPRPASERALEGLVAHLVAGEPVVRLVGPAGLGKTMLLNMLPDRLTPNWACIYVGYPSLTPAELWTLIGQGEIHEESAEAVWAELARDAQFEGGGILLCIDDAHAMPTDTREALEAMCRKVAGLHAVFAETSDEAVPSAAPKVPYFETLTVAETADYIRGRLDRAGVTDERRAAFEGVDVAHLQWITQGIPARIHVMVARLERGLALPGSAPEGHEVVPLEVARSALPASPEIPDEEPAAVPPPSSVTWEPGFVPPQPQPKGSRRIASVAGVIAALLVLALALALGLGWWMTREKLATTAEAERSQPETPVARRLTPTQSEVSAQAAPARQEASRATRVDVAAQRPGAEAIAESNMVAEPATPRIESTPFADPATARIESSARIAAPAADVAEQPPEPEPSAERSTRAPEPALGLAEPGSGPIDMAVDLEPDGEVGREPAASDPDAPAPGAAGVEASTAVSPDPVTPTPAPREGSDASQEQEPEEEMAAMDSADDLASLAMAVSRAPRAELVLTFVPSAWVFVDGRPHGEVSRLALELAPGPHRVLAKFPDGEYEAVTVELGPDGANLELVRQAGLRRAAGPR